MPRRRRVHLDWVPLHIVQRGHNRDPCFFEDRERHAYLGWLPARVRSLSPTAVRESPEAIPQGQTTFFSMMVLPSYIRFSDRTSVKGFFSEATNP